MRTCVAIVVLMLPPAAWACESERPAPQPCSCADPSRPCADRCPTGEQCWDPLGVCTRQCSSTASCSSGLLCVQGLCVRLCNGGQSCPEPLECKTIPGPAGPAGDVCVAAAGATGG